MPRDSPCVMGAFKHWINPGVVSRIANAIHGVHPSFDRAAFNRVSRELARLELKPRVRRIARELSALLPDDPRKAIQVLVSSLEQDPGLEGFALWPYTQYIEEYATRHPQHALDALYVLTTRFTGEFAIRPYLVLHEQVTLERLMHWTSDPNEHVRRLVSEGSRPLLPWGVRLPRLALTPLKTIPLLERLKYDDSLYVRKSVANHLNDLSKSHGPQVVQLLRTWINRCPDVHRAKIDWISRRATRTLVKKGDPSALRLLGVDPRARVQLSGLRLDSSRVRIGGDLHFDFRLRSHMAKEQRFAIDYAVHHQKANGTSTAKVFKLKLLLLAPHAQARVSKRHSFKLITTRRYYPGPHRLEVLVNGQSLATKSFKLTS